MFLFLNIACIRHVPEAHKSQSKQGEGSIMSIIKTFLKCTRTVQEEIDEIVQLRSRVESYGNCVFTIMLLLQFKETGQVSEKSCSQSAVSAAMRSVCRRPGTCEKPTGIRYAPCKTTESYMSIAQENVTSLMSTFDDDGQLSETFNQSAKQFFLVRLSHK